MTVTPTAQSTNTSGSTSRPVDAVAHSVADQLSALDPDNAATYEDNAKAYSQKLAGVTAITDSIAAAHAGAPVAQTEPIAHYLLVAAELKDATPEEFTSAIEDGNDPSPAANRRNPPTPLGEAGPRIGLQHPDTGQSDPGHAHHRRNRRSARRRGYGDSPRGPGLHSVADADRGVARKRPLCPVIICPTISEKNRSACDRNFREYSCAPW